MRLKSLLPIYIFSLLIFEVQAQTRWQAATIVLEGHSIQELIQLGLACDHGNHLPGKSFTGDFTLQELEKIRKAGFKIEYKSYKNLEYRSDPVDCKPSEEQAPEYALPSNYPFGSLNGYLSLQEIYETLELMEAFYPNLITVREPIGNFRTFENKRIYYVKISDNPKVDEKEPEVLYTALHHAREPASMSQMIYFMWYLLENYNRDTSVRNLVNSRELYFIPCVNPDGYQYNENTDPNGGGFWRKNRNPNTDDIGTDLNRNYGLGWAYNNDGSSPAGTSEVFRGSNAFSEVETQAIKYFCENRDLSIVVNYHSFGDLLILPWGYLDKPTEDSLHYFAMAHSMTRYNNFRIGTSNQTLNYSVNGVSDDWMYGERRTKKKIFAFTPEVGYAFWPERKDILAINQSTQYMNFMAAWNAGECAQIKEISSNTLTTDTAYMEFELTRTGILDAPITISAYSSDGRAILLDGTQTLQMSAGETRKIQARYILNAKLQRGDTLHFTVKLNTGAYGNTMELKKVYMGHPDWSDNFESTKNWYGSKLQTWELTDAHFVSSPNALTDSPDTPMDPNTEKVFQSLDNINLENARYAYLRFKGRWQMDYETDYAQIRVSTNGRDFQSLCGMYTIPGTLSQAFNEPVYCGVQDDWVTEWIDLNAYIGKKIQLQLYMYSGQNADHNDGIYIDDIEIFTNLPTNSSNPESNVVMELYPQPAHDEINIRFVPGTDYSRIQFKLLNVEGKEEQIVPVSNGATMRFNTNQLSPGMYILRIDLKNGHTQHYKFVIH